MLTASRATCHGRRRASGTIMIPISILSVCAAIAVIATHGSTTGAECDSVATT